VTAVVALLTLAALVVLVGVLVGVLVAVRARRGWRPAPPPTRAVGDLSSGSGYGGADLSALAAELIHNSSTGPEEGPTP
jgi:hypothetical protein